jgi:fatty acid CoA ligase FadD36
VETEHILRDSGAALLLAHGEHPPTTLATRPISLRRTSDSRWAAPAPERAALIMYTSGTTGAPKGAVLSHAAVEAGIDALAPARLLVSGSAALPVPVFERLHELTGHRPVERYGMTETLITVSTRAEGDRRPGYVGLPLRGMETMLVGEDGAAVPQDGNAIGELRIRGASLFDGYLNRPEATAASWAEGGWFRTGDVATIDADGWHRIVGRASTDLIKSGGYRIGAGEVENVLLGHPAVREAAVVGLPDPDLGQRVVAYVVAGDVAERELIEFVSGQLSHHKRPRQIRFVDALPRNEMGKVQKRLLAET